MESPYRFAIRIAAERRLLSSGSVCKSGETGQVSEKARISGPGAHIDTTPVDQNRWSHLVAIS